MVEAAKALADVMRDDLTLMANAMIKQIMGKCRRLTDSKKLTALKGVQLSGISDYKSLVKTGLAVIATDAIDQVRKEIPKAKNVKLHEYTDSVMFGEFELLPPDLQRKIQNQMNLLVGKQVGDLQKVIEFAYTNAVDETDSNDLIQKDLQDSALGWLTGTSVDLGADLAASTIINSARNAFFMDEEVSNQLDALQFTNGDPVTEVCQDLDGTIFDQDDPEADRYYPPLHWRCKSYLVPILKGDLGDRDIEKLKPSDSSLDDQVEFSERKKLRCGCSIS